MSRVVMIFTIGLLLAGCSTLPTEFKSPCACDWKPINQDVKALS